MAAIPVAQDKISAYGLDAIVERLENGDYLRAIAKDLGVALQSLQAWIAADDSRSQACARAREEGSEHWDLASTRVIEGAEDAFALAKAKELAVHYRWRAKAIAPRKYGDKVSTEVTGANGGPVEMTVKVEFVG